MDLDILYMRTVRLFNMIFRSLRIIMMLKIIKKIEECTIFMYLESYFNTSEMRTGRSGLVDRQGK